MNRNRRKLARNCSGSRILRNLLLLTTATLICSASLFAARARTTPPQIIAYVFPQNSVIQPGEIAAQKLPRINYAFANIQNGVMVNGFPTDAQNFTALNA